MSDEQWLSLLNRVYLAGGIFVAAVSLFIYHFGNKVSTSTSERVNAANAAAQEALARQKQAELETEKIRQENLKLRIELKKLSRESDKRWHRITGGVLER
jgi:hypothetical protein